MADESKCLKCGGPLADHESLICGACFKLLPFSLRQEWSQAHTDRKREACISKVRNFILRLQRMAQDKGRA